MHPTDPSRLATCLASVVSSTKTRPGRQTPCYISPAGCNVLNRPDGPDAIQSDTVDVRSTENVNRAGSSSSSYHIFYETTHERGRNRALVDGRRRASGKCHRLATTNLYTAGCMPHYISHHRIYYPLTHTHTHTLNVGGSKFGVASRPSVQCLPITQEQKVA